VAAYLSVCTTSRQRAVGAGQARGGAPSLSRSLDIRERLTAADHGNTQWQRDLLISYIKVGDVLVAQE